MELPFAACDALTEISVNNNNEVYAVKDNCLYEKKSGCLERVVSKDKDIICVLENYGDKFLALKNNLLDKSDEELVLVTFLVPDEKDKYSEFSRIAKKTDFVGRLYKTFSDNIPDLKSNLIESILEMADLDSFYDRTE